MTTNRHALTLIEIMVVVAILGMLAAALSLGLTGKLAQANSSIAELQIREIANHLDLYRQSQRQLPAASEGLAVLTTPSCTPDAVYFLEPAKLRDPWGQPFQYLVPGPQGLPFEVVSYGADGVPGGEGEKTDISSAALALGRQ